VRAADRLISGSVRNDSPQVIIAVEGSILGDKAYYSDGLDNKLFEQCGIEMISLHRKNIGKKRT